MDQAVPSRTLAEGVYAQLRMDILHGRLRPGDRLRIEKLRDTYRVGATPLREALSRLSSFGLVIAEGQRGFRVAAVSVEDLLDVTRTRAWIETLALRLAIANGDRDWEADILAAAHRLGGHSPTPADGHGLDADWDRANRAFHTALVSACRSAHLMAFRELLYDLSDRYRRLSLRDGLVGRDLAAEHAGIMDAVMNRDADRAVGLVLDHFLETTRITLASDPATSANAPAMMARLREDILTGSGSPLLAALPSARDRP